MGAAPRERELEKAWRQHQPERARVPLEARRAVREFKARIAPDADRISARSREVRFSSSMIGRRRARLGGNGNCSASEKRLPLPRLTVRAALYS